MVPSNLAALRQCADQAPLQPRQLLLADARRIGSVSPVLGTALRTAQPPLARVITSTAMGGQTAFELSEPIANALPALALWLRTHGHAGVWRNEALAVHDDSGTLVGSIERGVVRPLGIATLAVHLVGIRTDGRIWLQQRAHNKATDPGKWDTLMGGMIAAGESLELATARETWEEAGLRPDSLGGFSALRNHGIVSFRRPVGDSGTDGYLVERIHALSCVIPDELRPDNQDGEVARFELVKPETVVAWIEAGALTLEAALILARCFSW